MNATKEKDIDFMEAVKTCLITKYSKCDGRARRKEFWYFYVAYLILLGIVGTIIASLQMVLGDDSVIVNVINIILTLLILIPYIAVASRRLHDIGKSGWWLLVSFIPIIGWILLLYWFVKDSDPEENAYGPNPKK